MLLTPVHSDSLYLSTSLAAGDINNDGDPDVTSSRIAMKRLHYYLRGNNLARVEINDK